MPEPVAVKQRMHLDLNVSSMAEVEAAGATVIDAEKTPVDDG